MAFKLFDRVQETSTSTGTGDFTLAGAVTGFSTFSSRYSTGDTLYYGIHAVNSSGVPTGEWEIGLGTYSGANTLTRTTVLSSSNSDAAVTFGAGTKRVFVTMTALQGASVREKLTADRTYYVRTDGSDSNDGLANTSGSAFLTIQKGLDTAAKLDTNGYSVTVKVMDGTWTQALTIPPCIGGGKFILEGNTTTPANCHLSVTGTAISVAHDLAYVNVRGLKITGSTYGIFVLPAGRVEYQAVEFGASSSQHIFVAYRGYIEATGNYSIVGGAASHIITTAGAYSRINSRTITLTGAPVFTTFAQSSGGGSAFMQGDTFSGTATGKRYDVTMNAILDAAGGGATYLPGNVAGTTATGGQYA